jgi:ferredoxin
METKDLVKDLQQCSGCGVCASVCPINAITMREDSMGFVYPDISSAMCVSCGKCVEICPYGKEAGAEPLQAYAAANRQQEQTEKEIKIFHAIHLNKAIIA